MKVQRNINIDRDYHEEATRHASANVIFKSNHKLP